MSAGDCVATPPQRALPSVDELLRRPELAALWQALGPAWAREVIRAALAERRRRLSAGEVPAEDLAADLRRRAAARLAFSLRPVINATGTILHTNLGRAPLAAAAAERLAVLARGYSNLEFDLPAGARGRRDVHVEALACAWTGAERTLVVNNNAAAVLLALNTLAGAPEDPGEAVISRGELVEIGGSFRIPEIMARSGARMVEVGTTNRTRIADYRAALTPRTRLLLRVHRSNFVMQGFVEQPSLAELVALGREHRLPVVEDLGSGAWLDLSAATGVREPLVGESIAAGAAIVTYSGDKLLGGPQAGLISGQKTYLDRLRANPLFRALRVDRLTYAALEATLRLYAQGREEEVPAVRMLRAADLRARAEAWAARLAAHWRAQVISGESLIGGGAGAGAALPTWLVALAPAALSAAALEARLRAADPPIVARIADDRVVLDPRTVAQEEEPALFAALAQIGTEFT
ncbi:MAG TPA: L-seryl-tRNA(Sec) selenium transferase [Terriglobales bacterium]|nr:L-seryl-tRNA(Sec) selenium transferase [Terriglobales bacterium]